MAEIDIVLINPGNRRRVFQGLGAELAAIEPPFWVAVLAAYLRNKSFSVAVIDSNAENLSPAETAGKVCSLNPLLCAVIVYGSQPSASTQNMADAGKICTELSKIPGLKVALGGLHPSALPARTMNEEDVDFVIDGEGPFTIAPLLEKLRGGGVEYKSIPGLWYRENGETRNNARAEVIKDLDGVLPIAAWDLLPMGKYRAHNWHCFDDIEHRHPYAAVYTSLGCPFDCVFCCINAPFGKPMIRFRSPGDVLDEIDLLVNKYNVRNLKIIDELFVLRESHYMTIAEGIIDRGYALNIWAYARVDTVKPENLKVLKKAGVNWLALGIESAVPEVRDGASKRMLISDIKDVVRRIQGAGIYVIGNYIFGLPHDNFDTMRRTLDMAKELNCEFANFYSAMAYPGSRLYDKAIENNWPLPDSWHGYSQHSYDCRPLPTEYLSPAEVLKFRDDAFHEYFEATKYLNMIECKFGTAVKKHIMSVTARRLKRATMPKCSAQGNDIKTGKR